LWSTNFNITQYNTLCIVCFFVFHTILVKDETASTVDILTVPRAGRSGVRFMDGARDLPLLQNVQTDSGAHLTSYSYGTGGSLT
jgi:hypothetical protein